MSPIEFRCIHCQALLRMPESAAGRDARCPACSKVAPVPPRGEPEDEPPQDEAVYPTARAVRAPGTAAPDSGPEAVASLPMSLLSQAATADTLPYIPKSAIADEMAAASAMVAPFSIRSIVGTGSRRFADRWAASLTIGASALLTWIVCQVLLTAVVAALLAVAEAAGDPPLDTLAGFLRLATLGLATVGSVALAAWLWAGLRRFGIHVARGESAGVGQLYARAPIGSLGIVFVVLGLPSWLLGAAGWAMGFSAWPLGFLAFVLDVLLASLLGQSISRLIDRRESTRAALAWSWRNCQPHWRTLAGLYGLLCGVYLASTLVSAGLALVVVVPWAEIVVAEAYLRLLARETSTPPTA